METIGVREFASGIEIYRDWKHRLEIADEILRTVYTDWYWLWSAVVKQVIVGRATAGDRVPMRELAGRAGITQSELEAALDEFLALISRDHELADLLDVDRQSVSAG
jgi:hypothetical protein